MAVLQSFAALRPRPELAERVASVPYDVVNGAEARALADGNEFSFLHVVRPEIDLPQGLDPHADEVYAQAKAGLDRLLAEGALLRDEEPALYLYRQVMGEHSQVGIVGACSVDEYDADVIKKHEKTRKDKEDDRTRHVMTLRAHAGPVFLTYRGQERIDGLVATAISELPPLYDFVAPDGVGHTVWRLTGERAAELERAFAAVPSLYVADGHHRSASASRARAAAQAANPDHTGAEEYNRFLAVLFPAAALRIMAYNRVLHDLNGLSPARFLERVKESFEVRSGGAPEPSGRGCFSMHLRGEWYELHAAETLLQVDDPVASLDAAILQNHLLGPVLGIKDPRTSERIDFVGGIRGTDELVKRVAARGGDGVAFSLYPLGVEQLMAVADAGRVLPPKSTWFEPKLRSGLLIHEF
jgi:uncharacterized protein (DUF1015 family)